MPFFKSSTEFAVTVVGSSEAEKAKTTFVVTGTPVALFVGFTDDTVSGVGGGGGGGGGGVEPPPPPQAKSAIKSNATLKNCGIFLIDIPFRKVRNVVGD